MSEGLRELYQEVILHHSKSPRNFGALESANRRADGHNPLCGDRIRLALEVDGGEIRDVRFEGEGCAISTASASVMTDAVKGCSEGEARRKLATFHALVTGEPCEDPADLGKLEVFAGVKEFPVRVKCAMLAWRTLEAALGEEETVSTE